MDEQLKFSWGHIIAFLALIFISYITFVGEVYKTDGDFTKAAITMVVVDVALVIVFIGSQMAKATAHKFSKRIWLERIGIFTSPIIFVVCMVPYFHFWTVHSHNKKIISNFTNAINASNQMFTDYEEYANDRIGNYQHMLERVISNRSIHPEQFAACGFSEGDEQIQKENMLKTLHLQLLSNNYDSLKASANKWIESSSRGASTWNVFLLGNTKEIKSAIKDWNHQLCVFSEKKLSNEEFPGNGVHQNLEHSGMNSSNKNSLPEKKLAPDGRSERAIKKNINSPYNRVTAFDESSQSLEKVEKGLDDLTNLFTQKSSPNMMAIITSVLLYLALLFPYVLQDRHTKSVYRLIGMEKGYKKGNSEIDIDTYYNGKSISEKTDSNDDYDSFTL